MTFLAFWDFSKTFQLTKYYLEIKPHQIKWFLGQNSYQMKIQEIDHSGFMALADHEIDNWLAQELYKWVTMGKKGKYIEKKGALEALG